MRRVAAGAGGEDHRCVAMRALTLSGVLLASVAAAASGCGGSKPAAARAEAGPCGRAAAAGVAGFLAAVSDGRVGPAERFVATQDFVWLVLGARDGGTGKAPALAANRSVVIRQNLRAYLRGRVRQHDRFTLDSFQATTAPTDGHIGFQLVAYRSADDLAGGRRLPLIAKGEWRCSPGLIRGLAGHADLRGGTLPADGRCPSDAARVAGARVC
jgi:hypothetical protein